VKVLTGVNGLIHAGQKILGHHGTNFGIAKVGIRVNFSLEKPPDSHPQVRKNAEEEDHEEKNDPSMCGSGLPHPPTIKEE